MVNVFENSQFQFELARTMGQTAYGGAEIGECLATAKRIVEDDYDSWHAEWSDTAAWLFERSTQAESRHPVSAREGFLRASNYFRTAEFFLHSTSDDARIRESSRRSVESFHRAAALHDPVIETVSIPYEGSFLPAYFYRGADGTGQALPTVVIHNGFDGTAEEIYAFGGRGGQERGYNVLAFEGPGQGRVVREQGLRFRPDWENVVTPVVDYLVGRDDVDTGRIALIGISMGGVLAPRAAAFEKRIAAVVAWDGVYDMSTVPFDLVLGELSGDTDKLRRRLGAPADKELDAYIEDRAAKNATVKWFLEHGSWVMGATTHRALLHRVCDFNVAGGIAEQINCPVLVLDAEDDFGLRGQPQVLIQHLTAPTTLLTYTSRRGGELHNQVDVFRRASADIYDWLDTTFDALDRPTA